MTSENPENPENHENFTDPGHGEVGERRSSSVPWREGNHERHRKNKIVIRSERFYECDPDGNLAQGKDQNKGRPSELALLTVTVPVHLRHHRRRPGPDTLEVGEVGSITPGSRDLALNILAYLYPLGCGAEEPVRCRVNLASHTAYSLHESFCAHFLAPMDPAGGEILVEEIRSWAGG